MDKRKLEKGSKIKKKSEEKRESAEAHFKLGEKYRDDSKNEEAIKEYKEAIRIFPLHVKAHNYLGLAYRKQGRNEDAMREYREAI